MGMWVLVLREWIDPDLTSGSQEKELFPKVSSREEGLIREVSEYTTDGLRC